MKPTLNEPLTLPNGAVLPNRIAKSAMSERLADEESHAPNADLVRLYEQWSKGGAGLLITGNVMVDRTALGEPGNVAITDTRDLEALRAWAAAATSGGNHAWAQLNHPGRQSPRTLSREPVAPSAIPVKLGGMFATPRALTEPEIFGIIASFARAARIVQQAGFTGVQIHGAHGYLISQFLSPLTNIRTDAWGGDPVRRRRFLLEVVAAIRAEVGPDFPIGVKLNSADFQRGGFSEEDSLQVVAALETAEIDMLEISGGTYERPAMFAQALNSASNSTRSREAFFLEYAEKVRQVTALPLSLTGGFRTAAAMNQALAGGAVDLVGMARPLIIEPDLPARLLTGESEAALPIALRTGLGKLDSLLGIAWYSWQLRRMGRGLAPKPNAWLLQAVLGYTWEHLAGVVTPTWAQPRIRRTADDPISALPG